MFARRLPAVPQAGVDRLRAVLHQGVERVTDEVGGPARRRVILLLACVLGLQSADIGTISTLSFQLERAFRVGNTDLGLLVTVSALVGAAGTVPMGVMADRFSRVPVLSASITVWAVAQAVSGLATSWTMLLLTRLALGAVTATAGPMVASLTGDFFPAGARGRMWSFILSGEVVGTGAGVLMAGLVGGSDWRAAFFALAAPSLALAWALRKLLPEPGRGGQSRLEVGATEIAGAEVEAGGSAAPDPTPPPAPGSDIVPRLVARAGVRPDPATVLAGDPEDMTLWQAVRYILKVPTNVVLIVASALGYFFLSGIETFAVIYVRGQWGAGQGEASLLLLVIGLGVLGGLVAAGRLGDSLLRQGRIDARLTMPAVGFVGAALLLAPALAAPWLGLALPLLVVSAALLAAPNPSLDAARLDVVPARLWGRAEGIRTLLRQTLQAFAPLVFGVVSVVFGGVSRGIGSGVEAGHGLVTPSQTAALQLTFLVMLVPVVAGAVWLFLGRRRYLVDVASASESDRRWSPPRSPAGRSRGRLATAGSR